MAVANAFPYAQPTPLLGRTDELEAIIRRVTEGHARLLSILGPAGVGKTRLALEAVGRLAGRLPDGAAFVDLTPVREARLVLPAIARTLGLADTGTRPLGTRLAEYLLEREMALVLDNFEQILPAAVQLAELLAAAPRLRLLVTSRVPLRLRVEQTIRLLPLTVPDGDEMPLPSELLAIPAVALFVERARAQRVDFELTEEQVPLLLRLLRRLDGLPLAIELAASQANVLPLAAIVRRLDRRLQSLAWAAQDLPERHRSLQAAIDWSYELLPEEKQRVFRHLGVFMGRVTLDAMAAVAGDEEGADTLTGLVSLAETSLILPYPSDGEELEPVFGMLETVREYAREQLEAQGELEAARRAHAQYFISLAEQAEPQLRSRDQLVWLRRLEAEHDNLRAALRWLLDGGEEEQAVQMAGALGQFWWLRGYFTEGGEWLEEALARTPDANPRTRARALLYAATLLYRQRGEGPSLTMIREALGLEEIHGDRHGLARALLWLGMAVSASGDFAEAARLLQDALAHWEELGDDFYVGVALSSLAYAPSVRGQYGEAADLYSASIARLQRVGEQIWATNYLFGLALTRLQQGDRTAAVQMLWEGLTRSLALQERWLASQGAEATLLLLAESGEADAKARLLGAANALAEATGFTSGLWEASLGLSLASLREQIERDPQLQLAYRAGRVLSSEDAVALGLARLEEYVRGLTGGEEKTTTPAVSGPLSSREQEVLRLVAQGMTSKQIGHQLFLSHRTVDHHLTSIFNKLGVDSRAQAVAVAVQRGLL